MKSLVQEREKAIELRRKGLSYNEILRHIPVAKSSLSLWLKELPLTKSEKDVLKKRKDSNISRGRIKAAAELRKRRLNREEESTKRAINLFDIYKNEPLFHTGIALYWAEGAKTSNRWSLINTDVDLIKVMVYWLKEYLEVGREDINFRLFIHKPYADGSCETWWKTKLGVGDAEFLKTIYKDTKHKVKQKPGHHGCLRIEVKNSKQMFFMMKVFKNLTVEYYGKQ